MNSIKKQKGLLICLGLFALVTSILLLIFGIILIIKGVGNLSETAGIVRLVVGILMIIFSIPCGISGVRFTWVGFALTATEGSIKMGNIAKDGGTVNMKKCDKCGTEIKDGEIVCSNCGKPFENK